MMFADEAGIAVDAPATPLLIDDQAARRWRDMAMARFRGRGLSAPEIGKLLNVHASTVRRRLKAMPVAARDHFATMSRGEA